MTETPKAAARRLTARELAQEFVPEALHACRAADGSPLHWVIRLRHASRDKFIRPMRLNGDRYELNLPDYPPGRKPLYGLDRIASDIDAVVWIVEGEKAADALTKAGLIAATSGGADSADGADWSPLIGRTCRLWPDNDEAGARYMANVAERLMSLGCAVSTLDVAAMRLPPKGDAVEWLETHSEASTRDFDALAVTSSQPLAPERSERDSWGHPQPIRSELLPVPKFDAEALLPDVLRTWIEDEAERMPCPLDYIATAAIVALGSVIGARCAVKPKARDSWVVVPNLWGGVVGLPSSKKSPAIGSAMYPVDHLIARARAAHGIELADFESNAFTHKAKLEGIESDIKAAAKGKGDRGLDLLTGERRQCLDRAPEEPKLRRYRTNDTTIEKVGEMLRDNPAGMLIQRDELVGLLASWDREDRQGDRAFYLEAWNGTQPYDTDRIGRGNIAIPNLCVSIFGGIQPDKLTEYLDQAAHALGNDGMLQRFQVLVYPDPVKWEWRDRPPNGPARARVVELFETLSTFDPVQWGATPADGSQRFPSFGFDAEAQRVFVEWVHELQRTKLPQEQADGHPLIAQHLAKYEKLFAAIALILHLADCVDTGRRGPITEAAAYRAVAWCDYLEAHTRRCYGLLADGGQRAAAMLAGRIASGAIGEGFTKRDVQRKRWRYLSNSAAVENALEWLEDEHWIRRLPTIPDESGRPSIRYAINPEIRKTRGYPADTAAKTPLSSALSAPYRPVSGKTSNEPFDDEASLAVAVEGF